MLEIENSNFFKTGEFMDQKFYDAVTANPIIAAVKDLEGLKECCSLPDIEVVFILFGDICTIADIVKAIKDSGKLALVHMDLVTGLSPKDVSVDFIKNITLADGIITTKPSLIKRAKELRLYTILRLFVIDSIALNNIQRLKTDSPMNIPDFIEILPGVMPKIIKKITANSKYPLIASGMIIDHDDVVTALNAGAVAISTTNRDVWRM